MKRTEATTARKESLSLAMLDGLAHTDDAAEIKKILDAISNSSSNGRKALQLVGTFGSFRAVMDADPDALANIVTRTTAEKIRIIRNAARRYKTPDEEARAITTRGRLEELCKELLQGERKESFYVIAVNAQCRLIGARRISQGTLSECSAYPRSVAEVALNLNAHSVFFAHNHPGGTCAPSPEDIQSTIQLKRLLNQMGIGVLDHIIIAGLNTYSLSQHGDVDFSSRR